MALTSVRFVDVRQIVKMPHSIFSILFSKVMLFKHGIAHTESVSMVSTGRSEVKAFARFSFVKILYQKQ